MYQVWWSLCQVMSACCQSTNYPKDNMITVYQPSQHSQQTMINKTNTTYTTMRQDTAAIHITTHDQQQNSPIRLRP